MQIRNQHIELHRNRRVHFDFLYFLFSTHPIIQCMYNIHYLSITAHVWFTFKDWIDWMRNVNCSIALQQKTERWQIHFSLWRRVGHLWVIRVSRAQRKLLGGAARWQQEGSIFFGVEVYILLRRKYFFERSFWLAIIDQMRSSSNRTLHAEDLKRALFISSPFSIKAVTILHL